MREPTTTTKSLTLKGLQKGKIGAFAGAIIGIASIAPAYTMTSGTGPAISVAGLQTPFILLVGSIPMLFVLMGYRELNRSMPDSGSTFTWSSRAFGPWIGWLGGWGLVASTALVLSNLAAVAVDFLFIALSQLFNAPEIADLTRNLWINIPVVALLTGLAAYVAYRGLEETKRLQYALVGLQGIALGWFVIAAIVKIANGDAYDYTPVSLDWFNPALLGENGFSFSVLMAGLSLSIFMFWGWDVILTMNEETKDPRRTPGRAALLTIGMIIVTYLVVSIVLLSFAGIGTTGLGTGNPDIQESLFAAIAPEIMGPFALLMSTAIFASSTAALQATLVSPSRTLQAMSHYGAVPKTFGRLSKYKTPGAATLWAATASVVFYVIMRIISEDALWDTITAMGIMVCFYYGITGLAAFWYFRGTWFVNLGNFFRRFLLPLLGGLSLLTMFGKTLYDSATDPDFGSGNMLFATTLADGSTEGGVGVVFVAGVVILGGGGLLMLIYSFVNPGFFRGKQIEVGSVLQETEMTPFMGDSHGPVREKQALQAD
ncbi:APC family permease [Gulosibacter molinativorax]|uniref:APC family permease n=1 Tax=Gulosibacter molinativorax TaxID=256821 RepID=A0ABT7C5A0_9MICO|nr:APC family permease [Gulosibacter molinativorax]MDJ1370215.1 APC family permease [Gulosibacter molinativorax]QUY61628.1 Large neutral amino acids transporter small subunit 2 [Gulosibacter molinativorax]